MSEIPVYAQTDDLRSLVGTAVVQDDGLLLITLAGGSQLVADLSEQVGGISVDEGFQYRRVAPDGRPVLSATFDTPPEVDEGYSVQARLTGPWRPWVPNAQTLPTDHVVQFRPDGFTIQHPLHERLAGNLWDCRVHQYMSEHQPPDTLLGLHSFTWAPDGSPALTPLQGESQ